MMNEKMSRALLIFVLTITMPPIVYFLWALFGPEHTVDNDLFDMFTMWSIAGLVLGTSASLWLAVSRKAVRWLWLLIPSFGNALCLFVGMIGTTVARIH